MSTMIMKSENIAAIAAYISRLLNCGFETNGMSCPMCLGNELWRLGCKVNGDYNEAKVFAELVKLNYAAYNGRYEGKETLEMPDYVPNDICERTEYKNGHFEVATWHFRMYKHIMCFNYQCAEDNTWDTDLCKGMRELEHELERFIITNLDEYCNLSWE